MKHNNIIKQSISKWIKNCKFSYIEEYDNLQNNVNDESNNTRQGYNNKNQALDILKSDIENDSQKLFIRNI